MAGDWIKMRVNLVAHPKVLRMAEMLLADPRFVQWSALSFCLDGYPPATEAQKRAERHAALRITRYVCVTSLLRFWGYANEHAKGEFIESVGVEAVDEVAGVPGFGDAIAGVGWVEFDEDGGMHLPGFAEHNTSAEVRKSGAAERQKAYRERLKTKAVSGDERDVTRDVTSHAREEKRREDKQPPTPKGADGEPQAVEQPGFVSVWTAWPKSDRKGGRTVCHKLWKRAGCERQAAAILAHVECMKATTEWTRDGGQYIPAFATYLRGQRWDGAEVDQRQAALTGDV